MKVFFLPGSRTGLTLVEVLVALGLLALGATSVLAVLAMGTASARDAALSARAAMLSETVYAQLSAGFDLSADLGAWEAQLQDQTHPDYPDLRYDVAFRPAGSTGEAAVATLTVRWQGAGPREEVFQTVLRRRLRSADLAPLRNP